MSTPGETAIAARPPATVVSRRTLRHAIAAGLKGGASTPHQRSVWTPLDFSAVAHGRATKWPGDSPTGPIDPTRLYECFRTTGSLDQERQAIRVTPIPMIVSSPSRQPACPVMVFLIVARRRGQLSLPTHSSWSLRSDLVSLSSPRRHARGLASVRLSPPVHWTDLHSSHRLNRSPSMASRQVEASFFLRSGCPIDRTSFGRRLDGT